MHPEHLRVSGHDVVGGVLNDTRARRQAFRNTNVARGGRQTLYVPNLPTAFRT